MRMPMRKHPALACIPLLVFIYVLVRLFFCFCFFFYFLSFLRQFNRVLRISDISNLKFENFNSVAIHLYITPMDWNITRYMQTSLSVSKSCQCLDVFKSKTHFLFSYSKTKWDILNFRKKAYGGISIVRLIQKIGIY